MSLNLADYWLMILIIIIDNNNDIIIIYLVKQLFSVCWTPLSVTNIIYVLLHYDDTLVKLLLLQSLIVHIIFCQSCYTPIPLTMVSSWKKKWVTYTLCNVVHMKLFFNGFVLDITVFIPEGYNCLSVGLSLCISTLGPLLSKATALLPLCV